VIEGSERKAGFVDIEVTSGHWRVVAVNVPFLLDAR